VALDDWSELVRRWQNHRQAVGRARAALEAAEAELLQRLGDADEGTLRGEPAVHREVKTRPGIDLERVREDAPELWRQLRQRFPAQRTRTRLKFPPRRQGHP
jgi:hypothetical protein